jgi:hypothetical protein
MERDPSRQSCAADRSFKLPGNAFIDSHTYALRALGPLTATPQAMSEPPQLRANPLRIGARHAGLAGVGLPSCQCFGDLLHHVPA